MIDEREKKILEIIVLLVSVFGDSPKVRMVGRIVSAVLNEDEETNK